MVERRRGLRAIPVAGRRRSAGRHDAPRVLAALYRTEQVFDSAHISVRAALRFPRARDRAWVLSRASPCCVQSFRTERLSKRYQYSGLARRVLRCMPARELFWRGIRHVVRTAACGMTCYTNQQPRVASLWPCSRAVRLPAALCTCRAQSFEPIGCRRVGLARRVLHCRSSRARSGSRSRAAPRRA